MTNVASGILQPKTISFEWKIENFFVNCPKVGDYHESPKFPIRYGNEITNWHLEVFPKGETTTEEGYLSLFLHFNSKREIEMTVDYKCLIMKEQVSMLMKCEDTVTFKGLSDNWGCKKVVEKNVVDNTQSGALINDTLTIFCEITFYPSDKDGSKIAHGYNKWIAKIADEFGDYEELLESGAFTDVKFNVQDKTINAHKAILSCRSPVFKAMFEHDMKEKKESVVDIADIDHDVMKELFRFIYSGKVKNIENIASDLFIAADKYQVITLKALCEKTLYDKLTVDNAVEYLKLTDSCNTINLKKLVIQYIGAHYKIVIKKPGFETLNNKLMYQIMLAAAEKE